MKIKVKIATWSRRYQKALSQHLEQGTQGSLLPALRLGGQAVALGLETLGLAAIHEQAVKSLAVSDGSCGNKRRDAKRAKRFFAETLVPIEKTHAATVKRNVKVRRLTQKLQQRAIEVSASTVHLESCITQRQAAEAVLKKSDQTRSKQLKTSIRLQEEMRSQMRDLLLAEEQNRRKVSLQLKDEATQTLLAIHLGLLTLKISAKARTKDFEKQIAITQRLVRESIRKFEGIAHEFIHQK